MLTLMKSLSEANRFNIKLITIQNNTLTGFEIPVGVQHRSLGLSRVRHAFLPLLRELRREMPDCVVSTLGHLNMLIILLRTCFFLSFKLIIREGSLVSLNIQNETNVQLMRWMYKHLYKKADVIICQSNAMKNDLMECMKLPEQKCVVMHNPVETGFLNDVNLISPFEAGYGSPHFLFVGRLDPVKRIGKIIEAFAEYHRRHQKGSLWIVGEGGEQVKLEAQARELNIANHVFFMGAIHDLNPWYFYADLFVMASEYEGLPNTLLEALAANCRVQVLNHPGGTREVLEKVDLEDAMVNHLDFEKGLACPLERKTRTKLVEHFSIEKVSSQFVRLIEN